MEKKIWGKILLSELKIYIYEGWVKYSTSNFKNSLIDGRTETLHALIYSLIFFPLLKEVENGQSFNLGDIPEFAS